LTFEGPHDYRLRDGTVRLNHSFLAALCATPIAQRNAAKPRDSRNFLSYNDVEYNVVVSVPLAIRPFPAPFAPRFVNSIEAITILTHGGNERYTM